MQKTTSSAGAEQSPTLDDRFDNRLNIEQKVLLLKLTPVTTHHTVDWSVHPTVNFLDNIYSGRVEWTVPETEKDFAAHPPKKKETGLISTNKRCRPSIEN